MTSTLRKCRRGDIAAMHHIRMAVRENQLVSTVLMEPDYLQATELDGCGWVVESDGQIAAFAVATATNGNLWALFVQPGYESRGFGRRLLETATEWLWAQDIQCAWLTTRPETRATKFYEQAGWIKCGQLDSGEIRYELKRPSG